MHDVPLSRNTKLNYAVGQVGIQMLVAGVSFFLMIFYTDVALVPPAVASAALLLGKVWYTISDPLFGFVIDRTRSKFGRRRAYLIYCSIADRMADIVRAHRDTPDVYNDWNEIV
jgi:GPH family glycoside/pentoside/hexuronide:cation symporter